MSTWASDHYLIVLTRQERLPRKASFKFENHWLHIQGFQETIQEAWNKQHRGTALSVLKLKLDETARALKVWSKPLFSNV
jgi:hypothetical protein